MSDDTEALQRALDSGANVSLRAGTYLVSATLTIMHDGQIIEGAGKDGQTVIKNTANSSPLIHVGQVGTRFARRAAIRNLALEGNSRTLEGIALLGLIDDKLKGDASKSGSIENVRINGIGSGPALRVSSWSNRITSVEITNSQQGVWMGSEANANLLEALYITNTGQEAIIFPSGPKGTPTNNVFSAVVVQQAGGGQAPIYLGRCYGTSFVGLYLERNNEKGSPANVYVSEEANNTLLSGLTHNRGGKSDLLNTVVWTRGKSTVIQGLHNIRDVAELVKIDGEAPTTTISGLYAGAWKTSNGLVNDISRAKSTIWLSDGEIQLRGVRIMSGSGSPEGRVDAHRGSVYLRSDDSPALWIKETSDGRSGWRPK